jgi:methionyl-tRNA formyltransferase
VPVKVWRASQAAGAEGLAPGTVLRADAAGLVVACGDGAVCLTELQKPGGKRLGAGEFLRGFPVAAGERFMPAATT